MRIALLSAVALPLLFAAFPASANDRAISAAMSAGAYAQAEKAIEAELRIYPGRPELLLNLATVYARTGRTAEARVLYANVLAQRDVLMDVSADKVVGSHAIAAMGLKQIETVQISSR